MHFSLTFRNVKVSKKEVSNFAYRRLITLWRRCAREFFIAAAHNVVIDTGMSYGSLLPLAAKVRAEKILRQRLSSEAHNPKKGWTDIQGNYHSEGTKSIAQGVREAQKSDSHISFGSLESPIFEFKFTISVFQFALHDQGLAGGPAWNAMEEGREAFLRTWDQELRNYIKSEELIDLLLNGNYSRAVSRYRDAE